MSSAHAMTSRPSSRHRGTDFAISSHATFRSLWLMSVPAAPASRRLSGGSHPVVGPGVTASTCWAKTGIRTSFATWARSDAGGARTSNVAMDSLTDGLMPGTSQLNTIPSRAQNEYHSGPSTTIKISYTPYVEGSYVTTTPAAA